MSQHDFNIANQTFPSFRADLNDALQASATMSAGSSAPTTPYAYQLWFDTTDGSWKVRNSGNTAWITTIKTDPSTGAFSSTGIDDNATSTAMTLDASNNLLVGTTSTPSTLISATSGGGIALDPNSFSAWNREATASNHSHLVFNQTGVDAQYLQFRKDGTTVGSIGTTGGDFYLTKSGSNQTGIYFNELGMLPMTSGSISDNSRDIGQATYRWQDLYLSGGVYLGGTGAANKLDDYEEGTWTPTCTSGTLSFNGGSYTKIGNTVTLRTNVFSFSDTTSSSPVQISGIPFTGATGVTATGAIIGMDIASTKGYSAYIGSNDTSISFYEPPNASSYETMRHNDLNSSSDLHVTITYQTSS